MANSYVYKYTLSFNNLKKQNSTKLKCNKDIVITHLDKGNGVVILNRDEYIKSMTELISDQKKFRKLKEDPVLKGERALQRTLREINKKIYLVILNIQIYILKVLNQLDSMEHLKYTKLSYEVLLLLFDLLSLQSALIYHLNTPQKTVLRSLKRSNR